MEDPNVNRTGLKTITVYTVATLPSAVNNHGAIEYVSDSDAPANVDFNKIAVGGGTFACSVRSDGTNWRLHF